MTFRITPKGSCVIPISRLVVNFIKHKYTHHHSNYRLQCPKIATGVEPIFLIAYTRHRLEITVVRKAKIRKFKKDRH
jgi:hypothetical protein